MAICVASCSLLVGLKFEGYLLNGALHALPFWCLSKMLRWHSNILALVGYDLFVIRHHAVP
jgi:hypothetical protein